ncbi:hypothetical protein [Streptococcus parauberis]|uniref:hypothetical protein n=1 Tax=Streptococcus parauberis TaxID=1348 RepID=UPI0037AF394E
MNELIKPLAKILDISASELERIVSSLNMNAPQIYERLIHEWQWYRVLDALHSSWVIGALFMFASLMATVVDDDGENIMFSLILFLIAIVCVGVSFLAPFLQPLLAPHIDMIMQLK